MHADLESGGTRLVTVLPGRAVDLAVDGEHVYVPHLDGDTVWVVGRRPGRLARSITAGSRPVAVALMARGLAGA